MTKQRAARTGEGATAKNSTVGGDGLSRLVVRAHLEGMAECGTKRRRLLQSQALTVVVPELEAQQFDAAGMLGRSHTTSAYEHYYRPSLRRSRGASLIVTPSEWQGHRGILIKLRPHP